MRKRHWSYQGEKNRNAIVAMHLPCAIAGPNCVGYQQPTADHIIPRSLGGPDVMENLQPACKPCNNQRQADWVRGERAALASFFSDGGYQERPLPDTPPHPRWSPLSAADYRQAPTRDDRSR